LACANAASLLPVCVQFASKLATLCIQAHQQKAAARVRGNAVSILARYLPRSLEIINNTKASRMEASLRQQLQESRLLQHMASMMTDITDELTVAAAAAFADAAPSDNPTAARSAANGFRAVLGTAGDLLQILMRITNVLNSTALNCCLQAALPIAPAAVRLILTVFQTCSRFQQLLGREGAAPAPVRLLGAAYLVQCTIYLGTAYWASILIAIELAWKDMDNALQALPGARELLLCPELVPCLTITVLLATVRLGTGAERLPLPGVSSWDSSTGRGVVRPLNSLLRYGAAGSSSAALGVGSSCGSSSGSSSSSQGMQAQGSLQQPAAAEAAAASASASAASSSSSGKLANGMSLEGLSPLCYSLLDLLRFDKATLQVAAGATAAFWSTPYFPDYFTCLIRAYMCVHEFQVSPHIHCQSWLLMLCRWCADLTAAAFEAC
jgi:hypothetical protein